MSELRGTVLVVGAGVLQVPAVERARERGCRVVAVDRNPTAPGFARAHVAAPIDTADVEAVVGLARAEGVAGVLTVGSDVALPAVSAVARELGLVGPPVRAVDLARDKAAQWGLFRRLGGARRGLIGVVDVEQVEGLARGLRFPLVVKPVDGAGGRGSSVVKGAEGLRGAVERALRYSQASRALAEEFVEGTDHTAEVFLVDGRRAFGVITDKALGPRGLVPREHVVPTALSPREQEAVWGLLEALCREIGLTRGPLDVDFKMTPEGPELLEFAPRLGGNELPRLLERATGVDLVDWALEDALGRGPSAVEFEVRPAAVRMLFARSSGLVAEVPTGGGPGWPSVEVAWDVTLGDRVREATCSADRVGYVLARGPTPEEARARARSTAAQSQDGLRVQA